MSSKSFLKVVAPQMWWHMLHRGGSLLTNVRCAMETLKAVWYYFVPAGMSLSESNLQVTPPGSPALPPRPGAPQINTLPPLLSSPLLSMIALCVCGQIAERCESTAAASH
eukprot:3086956-Rhodomonas_salina.1